MAEDGNVDFTSQYRAISNKLKKRFLRKTNAAEPSDQFGQLALECERAELPEYSALSWLGVATCESTLGHPEEESRALVNAAAGFNRAADDFTFVAPHHLHKMGEWCLKRARQGGLAGPGTSQRVTDAETEGSSVSASERSSWFVNFTPSASPHLDLFALDSRSQRLLIQGDFEGALRAFTEMDSLARRISPNSFGVYKDIHFRCEICRVLLVLLLGPSPQRLPPDQAKLLDKYTWVAEPDAFTRSLLGEEVFFLLQSVVMCCQSDDRTGLEQVGSDLAHVLKCQIQIDLLIRVIRNRTQAL